MVHRAEVSHDGRNDRWIDIWSFTHLGWGIALGAIMDPFWALVLLIAWEPLEILVLGPVVHRVTKLRFGHESWKNSMTDVWVDAAGVAVGAFLLPV